MDVTLCASDLLRTRYVPAAAATANTTAAVPAIRYLRELLGAAAAVTTAEPATAAGTLAEIPALPERPESRSRFSRARSVRSSAALWYRRLRSFSIAFRRIGSSPAGSSGFSRSGDTGVSSSIRLENHGCALAPERQRSCRHLIKHCAERKQVTPRIQLLRPRLFR